MPNPDRRTFLTQTVGALAAIALVPDPLDAMPFIQSQGPRLGVGLVGAGRQGRAILAELQKIPQVQLTAICDTSTARLKTATERIPDAQAATDHRALLDMSAVQAVIVATPTHLHRPIVEDAVAAGRHVYCEAPIASTVDDCRALASAAAAAKTVCQAGFLGRSNPVYRRAQPLANPELRDMVSAYAQFHRKTSWRFPAADATAERAANWRLDPEVTTGLAGEVGAQQFDVAHWLRGKYPVRAQGRSAIRLYKDGRTVPDTIELDLIWDDGVALRYQATLASSYGGQYETFHGVNAAIRLGWTHGWLFKEADAPTQGWEVYATRQQMFGQEGIVLIADATKLAAQGRLSTGLGLPHPPLYYPLMDFVKSALESSPVACSMEEGARATIVGILANEAVVKEQAVTIPALR